MEIWRFYEKTVALRRFIRFSRFSALSLSAVLPLLGAATMSPRLAGYQILGLIGVATAFHGFAYALNDVIDLAVDRTESLRAEWPLVQGTVRPWQMLAFALLQVPLALALTIWLGGNSRAYATLGASFALMTVYNLWGKCSPFPPLTDAAQGLAWGTLALYGAAVVPGRPTELMGVVFAFVVVFIVMANGVHGSLRDLANDLNCGVRSTAIMLGARPQDAMGQVIPRRLRFYTLTLQAVLFAITLLPLACNWFSYKPLSWSVTTGTILILAMLSMRLLMLAFESASDRQTIYIIGLLHLIVS
nr:UbiA prenyltransferase family protein [Chloroflexota bacterium]